MSVRNYSPDLCNSPEECRYNWVFNIHVHCQIGRSQEQLQKESNRTVDANRLAVNVSRDKSSLTPGKTWPAAHVSLWRQRFFFWGGGRWGPTRTMILSFTRFLYHTGQRTTFGRTPLDDWSARLRDLYLTINNTHNRQTSVPSVGFEPRNLSRRVAADRRFRPRGHRVLVF